MTNPFRRMESFPNTETKWEKQKIGTSHESKVKARSVNNVEEKDKRKKLKVLWSSFQIWDFSWIKSNLKMYF